MWHRVPKVVVQHPLAPPLEVLMTTATVSTFRTTADLGPVLVSELPAAPVVARTGLLARLRDELTARREHREFLRAVNGSTSCDEVGDLWAARRRD